MTMDKKGYVYILTNKPSGVLYVGMTTNLARRLYEHKNDLVDGFTKKYKCKTLVYFEEYDLYAQAIRREKRLKEWKRQWKIDLVETLNPEWRDLYNDLNN